MLPRSLLLLLAAACPALAIPAPGPWSKRAQAPLTVPLNGLPAPTSLSPPVTLKYVTLGLGHQNYSCASPSSVPAAVGATAALFDVKDYLDRSRWSMSSLPGLALSTSTIVNDIVSPQKPGSDDADYNANILTFQRVGRHFFSADKVPNFVLSGAKPLAALVAAKVTNVPAPQGSCPGPDGAGAVDWLLLKDNGQNRTSGGLQFVYRVETAGGSPPATCSGVQAGSVIRVPYAAEYWFYGT